MQAKVQPKRQGLIVILALAALAYLGFIWRSAFSIAGITYFTLVDDAMVSMRYAQHLAHGLGLVWNIGQKPVEGFTNPGWMLLMTLLHLLPIPAAKISLGVMLLSALILLVNVVVVYNLAQLLQPDARYAPLAAAAIAAFYFPLIFWSLRGMEVGPLALLIDAALLQMFRSGLTTNLRSRLFFGALLSFAVLVRLDALIAVFILLAFMALRSADRKSLIMPITLVVLTTLAILVFQRLYFGDWLPNTYYQKMAGTAAWERVHNGLLVFYQHALWDTALPGIVALAAFAVHKDFRRPELMLLAVLFAAQCAYSVWVGGDYAEVELDSANRFITQGMPALITLFSLGAERLLRNWTLPDELSWRAGMAAGVAVLALAVMSGRPWTAWARDNAPLLKADIRRTRLGLFLARNTEPQAVIAVHAAGQIPYFSNRTTIDLLGLNDPVVAKGPVTGPFYPGHDKWNYAYSILQLRPDLVADNWIKLPAFMKDITEYRRLNNGIYVRVDSTLINREGLSVDYR